MEPPKFSTLTRTRRNLPHWQCESAIYWVTFRLADSLPQGKLRAWSEERDIWLKFHPEPWSNEDWAEYNERFGERMEAWLDAGYGECVLAKPEIREIVKKCMFRFDGERLHIHSAVIMPNHVHALIAPISEHDIVDLLFGMKNASAREVNRMLGKTGQFWMHESYDHIVRSPKQYLHYLCYIAENPKKAHLSTGSCLLYKNELQCNATVPVADSEI